MGVVDAPGWVLAAWRRSLEAVGATADREAIESCGERLIERWSDPSRIHHNLKRLIGVLARVDELGPETHNPDVVRIAAWFHGAAFDAAARQAYAHRGGVDEIASADLARAELTELGVPSDVVDRVSELIIAISRHSAPKGDIDAQALCDADLGGLAAEPQRYQAYRREVREEYRHIPDRDYLEARLAIVTKLLGRNNLFASPLAQSWEDAARENLTAEHDRLTAALAEIPAAGSADAEATLAEEERPDLEDHDRPAPAHADPEQESESEQRSEAEEESDAERTASRAGQGEQVEDRSDAGTVPSLSRPPKMPAIKYGRRASRQ
ncbi:hypothetical protein [Ruania rhizosphaerae]|uniref:HD domain-containing protein n=1 Tax=Ruania rhizosphaerae TaxID=1840413 RepID=UPI00190F5ACC|nr:hypothetical protein [Ruania rhizosphaerae]